MWKLLPIVLLSAANAQTEAPVTPPCRLASFPGVGLPLDVCFPFSDDGKGNFTSMMINCSRTATGGFEWTSLTYNTSDCTDTLIETDGPYDCNNETTETGTDGFCWCSDELPLCDFAVSYSGPSGVTTYDQTTAVVINTCYPVPDDSATAAPYAMSAMQECNADVMYYTDTECATAMTGSPTKAPVPVPSMSPSVTPSMSPSATPTAPVPSATPTKAPTPLPTVPTEPVPSASPSMTPSMMPTEGVDVLTYLSGCDNTTPAPDSSVARFGGVLAVSVSVVLAMWM